MLKTNRSIYCLLILQVWHPIALKNFECNSTISSTSKSNESTTIVSLSTCVDLSMITYQYDQINHFDSLPNQLYFFLNMFHPFLGGTHGIVWHTMAHTGNFATNVSTLEATQVFSKPIISFSSPHQNIVLIWWSCCIWLSNKVMSTTMFNPIFQVMKKTSTNCLWAASILYKPIYQYQLHSTFPIQHAYH